MVNQVGELFSIARAAARIHVQNHESLRGPNLLDGVEAIAVICKRPAMNLKDQRILLRRIEIRRLHDPSLDFALVNRRLERELFYPTRLLLQEELLIKRSYDARLRISARCNCNVARIRRR